MVDVEREQIERRFREFADSGATFDGNTLVLRRWNDTQLDPPVHLHLTTAELLSELTATEETRDALWPDRSVEEAGMFLFAVHLGNLLNSSGDPQLNHVVKDPDGALVLARNPAGDGAVPRFTAPAVEEGQGFYLYAPLTGERYPTDDSEP